MIGTIPNNLTKFSSQENLTTRGFNKISHFTCSRIKYLPSDKRYNITISSEKKFIWFRVAKVGTTSVLELLKNSQVKLDSEQLYNSFYPVKYYQDFFKFGFVRNPWDRLVSSYKNKIIRGKYFDLNLSQEAPVPSFDQFVDLLETVDLETSNDHFRIQSKLIDLNNIDFVGRYENFESDLRKVLKILSINSDGIPHKNQTSQSKHYRSFYSQSTKEKVQKLYSKDIRIFGYEF